MKRLNPSDEAEKEVSCKLKYRVHRVRFYEPNPKAINAVAYDSTEQKVAVVRADFSIELWNLKFTPCVEGVIPGDPDNSVEAVVWLNGRLFTAGLNAHVTEYDIHRRASKYSVAVTSGPAWCMALNYQKTHIAVGTEEGYVCIFEAEDAGLNFFKTLNKQEGRVLSLAWHRGGNIIVTGSADVIRIMDIASGRTMDRILVGRSESRKETLVWCLAITSDFTIISGDSSGRTSFWDGQTTTLISSFKAHSADVLSLSLTEDEKNVFTSGVDPLLMEFSRVSQPGSKAHSWVKSVQRTIHTHDVRSLVCAKNCIISGGVDTCLVLSSPTMLVKHFPFEIRSHSALYLARSSGHLLLNYKSHVDLWKLGTTALEIGDPGEDLALTTKPLHLAQVKAKQRSPFICAAVSDDCKWLACSSLSKVLLYNIQNHDGSSAPYLQKTAPFAETLVPSIWLLFTDDSSKLVLISPQHIIQVCKMDTPPVVLHTFPARPEGAAGIHLACLSAGHYLAVADSDSCIRVYDLSSFKTKCKLPQHKGLPTAMKFCPDSTNIVIAYSDNRIVEFNVATSSYSSWYKKIHAAGGLTISTKSALTGLAFDPKCKNVLLVYNDHELFVVDKDKELQSRSQKGNGQTSSIRRSLEFKWLANFDSLKSGDMVAVEVPPTHILQQLPPPLWQKKYGT